MSISTTWSATAFHFEDDEVVNFVDNHLSDVHPKFEPLRRDEKPCEFGPKQGSRSTENEGLKSADLHSREDDFKEAMLSYLQSSKGQKLRFDIAQHFEWVDVLEEVKTTQERYNGAGKEGILGSMRGKLRSFDSCAGRIESWLKFVPSDAWQFSLVCGGIKLVLKVSI